MSAHLREYLLGPSDRLISVHVVVPVKLKRYGLVSSSCFLPSAHLLLCDGGQDVPQVGAGRGPEGDCRGLGDQGIGDAGHPLEGIEINY